MGFGRSDASWGSDRSRRGSWPGRETPLGGTPRGTGSWPSRRGSRMQNMDLTPLTSDPTYFTYLTPLTF
jgi:hypothetical protein